jgi:hypothetical protein
MGGMKVALLILLDFRLSFIVKVVIAKRYQKMGPSIEVYGKITI